MKLLGMTGLFVLLLVPAAIPLPAHAWAAPEDEEEIIEELDFIEEVHPLDSWAHPGRAYSERTVNIPLARTTRRGTLLFVLNHRTWKTFTDEPGNQFLGFDNGQLKIGLGARYGILDNFDVGLQRINGTAATFNTDTWDVDLRYRLLKQEKHQLDLAVRGGMTWMSIANSADDQGWFGQLILNRTLGRRLRLGTGLHYHNKTWNESRGRMDKDWSLAVPATLDFRFTKFFSWHAEMVANVDGFHERYPVLSTSVRATTNKHTFSFVVSNTQYFGDRGIGTNTFRDWKDLILGFTITREFPLWRPGE
jgi:hypothetical protein